MLDSLKDRYVSHVDMQKSFFYTTTIEENKRFSADVLRLNFSHISPYKTFDILPLYDNNRVLLWFIPKNLTLNTAIIIPEAYLLYLECKKTDLNGIFIVQDAMDKLLVIKEGRLEAAYCGYNLQAQKEALLDEYSLENIYLLSSSKAKTLIQEAFDNYPLWQYYHWYHSNTSPKEQIIEYLNKATLPIAILIALFITSEYAKDRYIQNHYQTLQDEYVALKKQNDPYRKELKAFKKSITFNNLFYDETLRYPNSIDVMDTLFTIVSHDLNNTIKNFKLSGEKLNLTVETNDVIGILNDVLKSGYVTEFKVKSSRKIRRKNKEYVAYEGKLKTLKDRDGE